jgi:hypothetical protein
MQELASTVAVVDGLTRMLRHDERGGGSLFGTPEADAISQLVPRLRRKLAGAALRAATFEPPAVPISPPPPVTEDAPSESEEPASVGEPPIGDEALDVLRMPLRDARRWFERAYFAAAMLRCQHNAAVAFQAGMERCATVRKLKALGIPTRPHPGRPKVMVK